MQSMQRQFGKILNKGPGENAKVAVLLNDYEDADHVLSQVGNSKTNPWYDRPGRRSANLVDRSSTTPGCGGIRGPLLPTPNCRL